MPVELGGGVRILAMRWSMEEEDGGWRTYHSVPWSGTKIACVEGSFDLGRCVAESDRCSKIALTE